jgi:hypothetical protein
MTSRVRTVAFGALDEGMVPMYIITLVFATPAYIAHHHSHRHTLQLDG